MTLKIGWRASLLAVAGAACLSISGCLNDGTATAPTRGEAWRFLSQASFGPNEQTLQDVSNKGYSNWIDTQYATASSISYTDYMNRRTAELKADNPSASGVIAQSAQILEAFYTRALTENSQLRPRLVFALSEIFVVSMQSDEALRGSGAMLVANYMDTLDGALDGTFRELLEKVTLSPAMGQFLTYRGNEKEDPTVGRQPDENYAREIMQLFTIGLYQLNADGTQKLDANGQPIPTYTSDDVKGLAKVFTGWGMYRSGAYASVAEDYCFRWFDNCRDPAGYTHAMVSYPKFHSTSAKSFLGVTVPAQDTPSPEASLKVALDTLANHPNAAPFFARQLIQRLVSSNPTPAYVDRVAARFTATGGNIKAVVKAVLLDDEARSSLTQLSASTGKLREPVLRITALLRAFKIRSSTLNRASSANDAPGTTRVPYVTLDITSDATTSLGQTPLYAPSVFNFFRPGYTPPNPGSSTPVTHVAPEMQITSETSVTAYANFVLDALNKGAGPVVPLAIGTERDIQFDLSEQLALAYDVNNLVQHVADRLLGGTMSDNLKALLSTTLQTIPVPALDATGSNGQVINEALTKRVQTAILLVAVSPEFILIK
jgi:uncharacterized protein (DUF1800 family)